MNAGQLRVRGDLHLPTPTLSSSSLQRQPWRCRCLQRHGHRPTQWLRLPGGSGLASSTQATCRALGADGAAPASDPQQPDSSSERQPSLPLHDSSSSSSSSGTATTSTSPPPAAVAVATPSTGSLAAALQPAGPLADPHGAAAAVLQAAAAAEQEAVSRVVQENRLDLYKAVAVGAGVSVLAGILDHSWIEAHQELSMSAVFIIGYVGIMVEEVLGFNKAAVALLTAISLWVIRSTGGDTQVDAEVAASLSNVSDLIFFLLGAMTVVEVVDNHDGFQQLAAAVRTDSRRSLAWIVAFCSFCLSAVLDNLTTTIVILSLLQRVVPNDHELRRLLGAIVVVAANAGGAWTPIGDVTTTMLWIHGQITPGATMQDLFLPSLVSMLVPLLIMTWRAPELQGPVTRADSKQLSSSSSSSGIPEGAAAATPPPPPAAAAVIAVPDGSSLRPTSNRGPLVLCVGLGALVTVPFFKYITHLPPMMGMLSGLAVLWLLTDALHYAESKQYPRVQDALKNIDIGGIFFFFGILMSVEALNTAGLLHDLAQALNEVIPNVDLIAAVIGLASAVIDNVPLVAATMGMYDLGQVPVDSQLWQLVALCAGTGGSLLVIGSAAGVAFMSMEGAGFGWYARKVSPWVLAGYAASIGAYVAAHGLPGAGLA